MIDCSETTQALFYGKRDFARFQTDYINEQKNSGNLGKLRQRKRRQLQYQYETLSDIRRRRIENRILDIIYEGQRQQTANTERTDICFQQRCIPLRRISMQTSRPQQSQMANAA